MKNKYLFFLVISISGSGLRAQDSLHTQLDELVISDEKLTTHNKSQILYTVNDTLVKQSTASFTDFLLFNTPIYFKENGAGMVSSPSFRGTTAQQTSVLWNGLKVNSMFLGQTDFNAISYKEYDNIIVKPGGGSVLFGSGAIGGTIHLNNELRFYNHFTNRLQLAYGSFNTYRGNYAVSAGTKRWNVQAVFNRNQSENDFEVKNREWKNTNGNYYNNSFNAVVGYKINKIHQLSYMSHFYEDERHFALLSPNEIRTKYKSESVRNLLQWKAQTSQLNSRLRLGLISENYGYFDFLPSDRHSGGKVTTYIVKYDLDYKLSDAFTLSAVADYQHSKGEGMQSGIDKITQDIFSASLLATHQITEKTGYELGIKQEYTSDYQNPTLFSAGFYHHITNYYHIKINASKNYRVPTFNDIYWQPGGNPDLKPESSYQLDIAQQLSFSNTQVNLNFYTIHIADMIRWVPTSAGYWQASNTDKVAVLGAEISLAQQWKWQLHNLRLNGSYAYTRSTNKENNKQLVYVPFHKANGTLHYSYKQFSVQLQGVLNGKVYTQNDNNEASSIQSYGLLNMQLGYYFGSNRQHFIAFEIKNATDSFYENVENRTMPGRNYMIQLITQF